MKLNIPKWLRKPDAPSVDLDAQLRAAEEAAAAAQRATAVAQDAFDVAGTLETQQALTSAQDAERAAEQHVERAERLLTAAREREAAELRERQQARVEEIRGLVCSTAVREAAAGLITREVDLLIQLVETRVERKNLRGDFGRLVVEGEGLQHQLGDSVRLDNHTGLSDSPVPIAEALSVHMAALDGSDPRREMLWHIAHDLSPRTMGGAL